MSRAKLNTLLIKTPEGIVFSQLLAGPVTRFLAWAIDLACIAVIGGFSGTLLQLLGLVSADFARALSIVVYFVISLGYAIALEWRWRGQTVGKRVLRLRVMDADGLRLNMNQVVIRNLLRFADMLPLFYLAGGVSCLVSRRAQRLGDLAANTIVVRHPKIVEPDLDQLLAGKFNSLREYPHLAGRLRKRVSPAEAQLALKALLRRDEFYPAERIELFHAVANHFHAKVEYPAEVREGVADEQYVRNVVDVLFRARGEGASKVR
jgi:uncharacterized RDD family membrane protein YckC